MLTAFRLQVILGSVMVVDQGRLPRNKTADIDRLKIETVLVEQMGDAYFGFTFSKH